MQDIRILKEILKEIKWIFLQWSALLRMLLPPVGAGAYFKLSHKIKKIKPYKGTQSINITCKPY